MPNPAAGQEGKPMSDSQTITIPAADHAPTAETRSTGSAPIAAFWLTRA
jgi:hypothetical protein